MHHGSRFKFRSIFFISAVFSVGCSWASGAGRLQQSDYKPRQEAGEKLDVREFADQFRASTLPQLHLEGKTAREAIDVVGKLGFHCDIAPEEENVIFPSKPLMPFVACTRLFPGKVKIEGLVWIALFLENWTGDGTALGTRFDDLAHVQVKRANVSRVSYQDNRDAPSSQQASRMLEQALVVPGASQPVADFVKYAMTHDLACRAAGERHGESNALECIAMKPTRPCLLAFLHAEVTETRKGAAPFSLWSMDREVIARPGSWVCLKSRAEN